MDLQALIMTAEELAHELKSKQSQIKLVDVREPEEWEVSRIDGATLIPLGELLRRAPAELPDLDENIVLYCAHGVRSVHALLALQAHGYSQLRSLRGGICDWEQLPSTSEK